MRQREYFAEARKKIDPLTDEKFQAHTDYAKRYDELKDKHIFGSRVIHKIDELRKNPEGTSNFELVPVLVSLQTEFFALCEGRDGNALTSLLEEIFYDNEIWPELISILEEKVEDRGEHQNDVFSIPMVVAILINNPEIVRKLPHELIERMVRCHVDVTSFVQEIFQEQELPVVLAEVESKIEAAIGKGVVPISLGYWDTLKQKKAVFLLDDMRKHGTWGSFSEDYGIYIDGSLPFDIKVHVLIHEFIHFVAGTTLQSVAIQEVSIHPYYIEVDSHESFSSQRSGLGFHSDFEQGVKGRFRWLNEAITEDLAMEINGKTESEIYVNDRKLFSMIVDQLGGDAKTLFRNAYFENFSPQDSPEKKLQYYKKLHEAIRAKFGPRFLVQLDMFVNEQRDGEGNVLSLEEGLKKAIALWEKHGDKFPEVLEHWIEVRNKKYLLVSKDIVQKVKEKYPIFAGNELSLYHFDDLFEKLWNQKIGLWVPYRSKYDVRVCKEYVRQELLKDVKKMKRRQINPLIQLADTEIQEGDSLSEADA